MTDTAELREAMIASQLRPSKVSDPDLIKAFRAIPREAFVPADKRMLAYADEDVPLGGGRVMLEPLTIARLIAEVRPMPGESALAIGGVGYGAAVMAARGAQVIAVECDSRLAALAREGLAKAGQASVTVVEGPLTQGYGAGAPYDVILIEGAFEELPASLTDQLSEGGRLAGLEARGALCRGMLGKRTAGSFGMRPFMDAFAPVLPGFAKIPVFQF